MSKKLSARQEKVREGIARLQHYMNTYGQQPGYLDYSDDTIIEDVLYGLGIALDRASYQYADGFRKFKQRLLEKLNAEAKGEA